MDKENAKALEEAIINSYRQEEEMMILVFAQWCINNEIDPIELYHTAYPEQQDFSQLQKVMELTVSKEEAGPIPDEQVIGVLSLFGNEDLAFAVSEAIESRRRAAKG